MTTAADARRSLHARQQRREQARRYRARTMVRAKTLYSWLIDALGGSCALCGEDGSNAPLTVDHRNGLNWPKRHNEYGWPVRVYRYVEEFLSGVELRCLCLPCNSGYHPPAADLPEAPF